MEHELGTLGLLDHLGQDFFLAKKSRVGGPGGDSPPVKPTDGGGSGGGGVPTTLPIW